jgi:small subunit ribosomal protein S5
MFLKQSKSSEDAKKNLVKIPLNGVSSSRTKGKFGGARVFLIPASHGTGVIAGGAVRSVLESVGIHDVLSISRIIKSSQRSKSNFDACYK